MQISSRPFIIAEMSGNHNKSIDRAYNLIDEAAQAGVSAVKLQTYTADSMTLDIHQGDFFISDKTSPWAGRSLYSLYEKASTPWEWVPLLMDYAKSKNCRSQTFNPIFERFQPKIILDFTYS